MSQPTRFSPSSFPQSPAAAAAGTPASPSAERRLAVLYVDDEEQALKYFRRGLDRDFQVLTAPGVTAALALLEEHESIAGAVPIGVVITDQRMPGRSGVELLSDVRRRWPNIVRILITAYADIDSAVSAVNSGSIYRYIHKPATLEQLRRTLTEALEVYRAQVQREALLREKMSSLQRLVVEERVRSFAALAGGISHHLLNSMTAMSCFLEETDASAANGAAGAAAQGPTLLSEDPAYVRELWDLAHKERRRLLQIVRDVGQGVIEPRCRPDALEDPVALVRRGIEQSGLTATGGVVLAEPDAARLPRVKVDVEQAVRLMKTLIVQAQRLDDRAKPLRVSLRGGLMVWNAEAVGISVSAPGATWSEHDVASLFTPFAVVTKDPSSLGLEMLAALYVAYQHRGDVIVHRNPGGGGDPSFELLLPLDPASVRRPELGTMAAAGHATDDRTPPAASATAA